MLHIVFGESAGGVLRLALRQAGRDDEVLSLDEDLSFGWLASHYPDAPLPSPKTVENNFREEYWGLRRLSDARATETNEPSSTKNDRSPFRQPYLT